MQHNIWEVRRDIDLYFTQHAQHILIKNTSFFVSIRCRIFFSLCKRINTVRSCHTRRSNIIITSMQQGPTSIFPCFNQHRKIPAKLNSVFFSTGAKDPVFLSASFGNLCLRCGRDRLALTAASGSSQQNRHRVDAG